MPALQVFDPAMCCSTGVCGEDIDPALTRFAADVKFLQAQDVTVRRFNLSQEPQMFVDTPAVYQLINQEGADVLPAFVVEGEVIHAGSYPSREQLMAWVGLSGDGAHQAAAPADPAQFTSQTAMLVGIGAALAAGNSAAYTRFREKAEALGISKEMLLQAANTGLGVRQQTTQDIAGHVQQDLLPERASCAPGSGCC